MGEGLWVRLKRQQSVTYPPGCTRCLCLPSGRLVFPLRQTQRSNDYIVRGGLHPVVSWCLGKAGGIGVGDVVCDPMCGRGIVLAEAALHWPHARYVGLDVNASQVSLPTL